MIMFQITNCLAYKQSWRIFNLENSNKSSDTCTRSLVLLCVHQYSWKGILFAILFGKWFFFYKTLIFSICTFYFTATQLLLNHLSKKREFKYVNFLNWTYRTELTETKLHNSTYMTVTMVTTTFSKSKVGQFKTVEYVFLIYILCFIDQEIIHKKTHYKYKKKTQMNNIQN